MTSEILSSSFTTASEPNQSSRTQPKRARLGDGAPGTRLEMKHDVLGQYLTKKQAAEYLQISERTLCNWMARRLVTYIRMGRSVRFRKIDLDEKTGVRFDARN